MPIVVVTDAPRWRRVGILTARRKRGAEALGEPARDFRVRGDEEHDELVAAVPAGTSTRVTRRAAYRQSCATRYRPRDATTRR